MVFKRVENVSLIWRGKGKSRGDASSEECLVVAFDKHYNKAHNETYFLVVFLTLQNSYTAAMQASLSLITLTFEN